MKLIRGGITAAKGFTANGLYSGIKKSKKKDLALIYSERKCSAAGVFTTNKVKASCVVINAGKIQKGTAQAIIANSGNANCMTGKSGFGDSKKILATAAKSLKIPEKEILIASTGVIGKPLPIKNISSAIPLLAKNLSRAGGKNAAQAILTTDHKIKEIAAEIQVGGRNVRIGAIAKGAGMIHPVMAHATMLCFVTTDAVINSQVLQKTVNESVEDTFNMITIDGDTSTNDMVLVLANGMAGNKKIVAGSKDFHLFEKTLKEIFVNLAKLMVKDAEGATKFVEVGVTGAKNKHDARKTARSVASSNLLKCALYGSDPNWGRIAASVGYSGADVDPWKMRIYLGSELVLQNGGPLKKDISILNRVFAKKEIKIRVDLGQGKENATAYTCDFSPEYVKINSAYRT